MTRLEQSWWRIRIWISRIRRKLPYLVWCGDELDVVVTFREDRLAPVKLDEADAGSQTAVFRDLRAKLTRGEFPEIERRLDELGISFDVGLGIDGRDWQWDWSLSGPISVRFIAKATQPERRQ